MIRGIACLLAVVFFIPGTALAQGNCPEGFRYAGTLSGTGSFMTPLDERVKLRLPENATLDESFQQKKLQATNGKGGVQSTMRPSDVPKGLLLVVYGKSDKVYEQEWAISDPELKVVERDEHGKVSQYEFGMKLFCKVPESGANPQFGSCSVDVEVCYKRRP